MPRVFLITGCSTGFGNFYVQEVLDQGDYVVATARVSPLFPPRTLVHVGKTREQDSCLLVVVVLP
jgi:NAD(P)-dependent dehydrogenase (short-subunit alcohol dehydrogenase family)